MTDPIVGIDLGTTNSAVAIVQDGIPRILDKDGQRIIPSVVAYAPETGWLVGQPALNQYTLNPENTIRSIKRQMGSETRLTLGKWELSPQEISAFILRELKAIAETQLGQPVKKAVITVPAYFSNAQRQATKEAGEIAGLEVVRIINEPTAAALAYGLNNDDDKMALVYDLGGGTFDVSVVEMTDGVVEVVASHGDTALGGDDFDRILTDHLAESFEKQHHISLADNRLALARLNRAAEVAKIQLSNFSETRVSEEYLAETDGVPYHLDTTLTRDAFQTMTDDLLQRTVESLRAVFKDAEFSTADLNRILLVGGSTRMPAVWNLVAEYTGLEPDAEINPDEVVALGAAVQAAIIAGQPVGSILVDVTPYSLGIETAVTMGERVIPDIYNVLIHRNTTIPVTKEQIFSTIYPQQTQVHVKVYQGEAPIASDNILLGDFIIEDLQPETPGELPSVTVRFDFDVNGMLHVHATDRATDKTKTVSVQATQARLSPAQIAETRRRLEALAGEDEGEASTEPATPTIDAETQALLHRAQALLDGGSLADAQTASLKDIVQNISAAVTQTDLDNLAEALLDMLFELE